MTSKTDDLSSAVNNEMMVSFYNRGWLTTYWHNSCSKLGKLFQDQSDTVNRLLKRLYKNNRYK